MKSTGIVPLVPLALSILLAGGAAHADPAQTVRATELQAQAQSDATTLATLPQNTKVDVVRRSGAWSEIRTACGQSGWVRMLSLKLEAGARRVQSGRCTERPAFFGPHVQYRDRHHRRTRPDRRGFAERASQSG